MNALGSLARSDVVLPQMDVLPRVGTKATKPEEAAKEFTAMFMAQMLQPMMEGLATGGMFGGGHGEEMMRGFLVQEYGKSMSNNSGGGLTKAVHAELLRIQEQATTKMGGLK